MMLASDNRILLPQGPLGQYRLTRNLNGRLGRTA